MNPVHSSHTEKAHEKERPHSSRKVMFKPPCTQIDFGRVFFTWLELGAQQKYISFLPGEWKTKGPQKSKKNKPKRGELILGKFKVSLFFGLILQDTKRENQSGGLPQETHPGPFRILWDLWVPAPAVLCVSIGFLPRPERTIHETSWTIYHPQLELHTPPSGSILLGFVCNQGLATL